MGAVPSKRIPEVVSRMTDTYRQQAEPGESFQDFTKRLGKVKIRSLLDDLTEIPTYEADRTLYSDWGDPREFTIGDMGQGECAGEVVSQFDFALAASERQVFEAQVHLDGGDAGGAMETAYRAMVGAAEALVRFQDQQIDLNGDDTDRIVREFKSRFYDTKLFFDPYAGGKFGHYFLRAHQERGNGGPDPDAAHHRIEEAHLFVEAAYACHGRMLERQNVTV